MIKYTCIKFRVRAIRYNPMKSLMVLGMTFFPIFASTSIFNSLSNMEINKMSDKEFQIFAANYKAPQPWWNSIKDWLVPIAGAVSIISVAGSTFLAIRQYRLKLVSETRQNQLAQVDMDVKMLKVFVEIMNIANGRGDTELSERAIEMIFNNNKLFPEGSLKSYKALNDALNASILIHPVGRASQCAAIAAIYTLAKKHKILFDSGKQALESLKEENEKLATKYLDMLDNKEG